MHTFQEIHNRQRRALYLLLAVFVLGWGFTEWKPVFAGLILGSLFGLYNFWILVRRYEKFDRSYTSGKRVGSLGTAIRFASGVAAAALAILLPEKIDLVSTVIGLMIPYVLLLVDRIISHTKEQ